MMLNLSPADLAWIIDMDREDGNWLDRVDEREAELSAHDFAVWKAAVAR